MIFVPKMYQKNIFTINYNILKEKGIELLIFDLDNTIGHIHEDKINEETFNFLTNLKKSFKIVIASNSPKKRVSKFLLDSNLDYFSFCFKPSLISFKKIKRKYKIPYEKTAIIGDQILTDIFGGNRLGLYTILVDPISIDFKVTKFNRKIETIIKKRNNIIKGVYYEN